LNEDDQPEICAVGGAGYLSVLQADGSGTPGWPAYFGYSHSWSAPSIGDIDGDGYREVAITSYNSGIESHLFVFRGDGTSLPGFPVTYSSLQSFSCPVLADIDGDGDLEIFTAGKAPPAPEAFWAWDHTGVLLPGWPTPADPNMEGSAIVANVDAIPGLEIAIGDNWNPGEIFGYNADGTVAADFPIYKPGASAPNSPEIADVDGDGDLDMAMTMATGDVALWDFSGIAPPDAIEWGGLFHDNWNTNQYGFEIPIDLTSVLATDPAQGQLRIQTSPNPFSNSTRLSFCLNGDSAARLRIYDLKGRLIRSLEPHSIGAGWQAVIWDGRNAASRLVPSGVYFARVRSATGIKASSPIILLR